MITVLLTDPFPRQKKFVIRRTILLKRLVIIKVSLENHRRITSSVLESRKKKRKNKRGETIYKGLLFERRKEKGNQLRLSKVRTAAASTASTSADGIIGRNKESLARRLLPKKKYGGDEDKELFEDSPSSRILRFCAA